MNIEDVRDQIKEQSSQAWQQIQDSSLYISLKDRYDDLNSNYQKAIKYGALAVIGLFLLSIPFGYLSSSSESLTEFEGNRELVVELLRVQRKVSEIPAIPPGYESNALANRVKAVLDRQRLVPEQIESVGASSKPRPSYLPNEAQYTFVEAKVNKLNLNQIIDISYDLSNLSITTKLSGLFVNANADDNHYYDVKFQLLSFGASGSDASAKGGN